MKKLFVVIITLTLVVVGCSSQENKKDKETKTSTNNTTKIVENFLEHSYTENDIKQWSEFDEYASKQLKNTVKNQKQTYDDNGITKEMEDISLYKNSDNDKEYMYNIKVKTTDDNAKNIDYNQRYGIVKLKNEDGHIKVNNLKEVGSETYNGGD
ncbi:MULTISPECIES: TrsH/TraH family protein [unclassified Staphylococcus]|uniref:TrsH/TraH family protein n=1 Tax=unclassified Staphylococcus TaxID=91994 RepID=UPI00194FF362|nr:MULTISPECIES: TrsH/TraH family protein [unclassified Staphylococcus]